MDDLTLQVGGLALSGWTALRVTRGIERLPSEFDVEMTERWPGEFHTVSVKPGDFCQVRLGGDLVLTGYVDRWRPSLEADRHSIRVTGRGKCEDLVDCAAEWPNRQFANMDVLAIARALARPYANNITVTALADVGDPIPQFNFNVGETAWSVIERVCRYRGLLAYDDPSGNLILSRVASVVAASGLSEGVNVERAEGMFSMDERFSEYDAYTLTVQPLREVGPLAPRAVATDSGVPRHRRHEIISEVAAMLDMPELRAKWEAARRLGRSMMIRATVDSWRDRAGALWQPNTLIPVHLPSMRVFKETWALGEVTYRRDMDGTHADLVVMPLQAFLPEPFNLYPILQDVSPP